MQRLRNMKAGPEGNLLLIQNDQGVWEEYDPTWDLTIHCASEIEMKACDKAIEKGLEYYREYKAGNLIKPIHASWIGKNNVYMCSHCDWVESMVTNYCRNCGARMNGTNNS